MAVLLMVCVAPSVRALVLSRTHSNCILPAIQASRRVAIPCSAGMEQKSDYETLSAKLQDIASLRCTPESLGCSFDQTIDEAKQAQIALWKMIDRDPSLYVSGLRSSEPSFTRLFSHETWEKYTGRPPLLRWLIITQTWRFSTVLRAVFPIVSIASIWAYIIASLPAALLPRTSPVPMSLIGTALGLLLVFRTNNSYLRLIEARTLWSTMLIHFREISQTVATALLWDKKVGRNPDARDGAARVALYLAGFAWELRARLMGGSIAKDRSVIDVIYPPAEATFVAGQRVRPLQLLSDLRRELHDQCKSPPPCPPPARARPVGRIYYLLTYPLAPLREHWAYFNGVASGCINSPRRPQLEPILPATCASGLDLVSRWRECLLLIVGDLTSGVCSRSRIP